jgi:hypothetical protein
MTGWSKEVYPLGENHAWKAKPGYKIFVADRGAVRFDFPQDWIVLPGSDSIKFHDRTPPDDTCVLQVSVIHLPAGVDWSALPLTQLVIAALKGDDQNASSRGEIVQARRRDLEYAWIERRRLDPGENREAVGRLCLARGSNIQALITFDYWPEDAGRFGPVWDEVLRSLRLGEYVVDPGRLPAN